MDMEPRKSIVSLTESLDNLKAPESENETAGQKRSSWWPIPQMVWFVIVSGLAGALVNGLYTFFPSVMTTMEKRFNITNIQFSYILMANDISSILFAPFSTYYMAKKHIPRHISFTLCLMAIYSFIIISPHFIYGSGEHALSFTKEYQSGGISADNSTTSSWNDTKKELCSIYEGVDPLPSLNHPRTETYFLVLVILFTGHFISGVATSIFWCLLLTYLDDNVKKAKAPLAHSANMIIRFSGVLLANAMNTFGLKLYINPLLTPTIEQTDPRWIGAWWFTPAILCFLFLIPIILLRQFPQRLSINESSSPQQGVDTENGIPLLTKEENKSVEEPPIDAPGDKPSFKDMWESVKRLFKNKIFIYTILSFVTRRLAHLPYGLYMVKYMEQLYNISSADASGYIALFDNTGIIVGIMVSGLVTTKLRPSARQLQGFAVFVSLLLAVASASYIWFGCKDPGLSSIPENCSLNCHCGDVKFAPVCGANLATFNSPCEAGCLDYDQESKLFQHCSCIEMRPANTSNMANPAFGGSARDGPCKDSSCRYAFFFFLGTQTIINFLTATTWTSVTIIMLRSVEKRDKAFSLSLYEIFQAILVSIPGPFIVGNILDRLCIRRNIATDPSSVCWKYDRKLFSYFMNGSASVLMFISVFFGCLVWKHLKSVDIFDKELDDKSKDNKDNVQKE